MRPFLVTSTSKLLWVNKANRQGNIRSAFQNNEGSLASELYANIIDEIKIKSEELDWGLVFPLSKDGLSEALRRMAYYEIEDIEFIAPAEGIDENLIPSNATRVSWLTNRVIIVPSDRSYLGTLLTAQDKQMALIHNASRGICILE